MTIHQLSLGIKAFFGPHLPEGAYFLEFDGKTSSKATRLEQGVDPRHELADERIFSLTETDRGMMWVGYIIKLEPSHPKPVCYQPIVIAPHDILSIDAIYAKVTEASTAFRVRLLSGSAYRTVDCGLMELFHDERVPLLDGEATGKEPE